ncbi:MAG: hypothetical protein WKF55_03750 [Gemmatimonadaceae bacterium]
MTFPPDDLAGESATTAKIRAALLAILLLGMVGILVELFLMEHTDGLWQIVPIALLVCGICAAGAHAVTRTHRNAIRVLQGVMVVFVVSGFAGMILHYSGNVEFEREMNPETGGLGLIKEALMGATPALAPGTMIQLGLLGLASTYRHPATGRR